MLSSYQKIWIVDDDAILSLLVSKQLEQKGYTGSVSVYYNGEEAIQSIQKIIAEVETLPDLIFLDLNMPIMDGWDFLEEYSNLRKALPKSIDIYILTSSIDEKDRKKAENFENVKGYLNKPFMINDFLKIA